MKKLKRFLLVIVVLLMAVLLYVQLVNINAVNMTFRQKLLKTFYPAFMWVTQKANTNNKVISHAAIPAPVSFYSLSATLIDGTVLPFDTFKGKKILLVNTASDCGYTNQYEALQALWQQYGKQLLVIGFPANDFKEQEKGDDASIAAFCKKNYGVDFLLATKSVVVKGKEQNPVFAWLSDAAKNGWNNQAPSWNFSKYLVNEQGMLVNYFDPSVDPLSAPVLQAIVQP
jgi:glutathione peroxidase